MTRKTIIFLLLVALVPVSGAAQVITLQDALRTALSNYGTIKAKASYVNASKATVQQSKRDYLPNLVLSAQQDYGTINGQNGPLYGFGGLGVASSGLPLPEQNWNAAFGALYLANVNWEFFSFGRARERIRIAGTVLERDENDLAQEQFQHQVRVAAAYLNLLAAQRIAVSQQKNLERALVFRSNAVTRATNGVIAGVDSSFASAEVSNARISLVKALDLQQEQTNKLAVLMGVPFGEFVLDTAFISRIPASLLSDTATKGKPHPLLAYYRSRVEVSNAQVRYYTRMYYPSFTLFGVMQGRGSGFEPAYTQDQTAFTHSYGAGITPVRGNYLLGVGVNWNLTTLVRNQAQVKAQQFISQGLNEEYLLVDQQLKAQMALADAKIKNALAVYEEAPVQVKAATDAYTQKNALYGNGLTTLVEVTQTLYALNRAETDRDIAYANVWQALLMKAAATGDLDLFLKEF